jgi:hypothetical protein
MVIRIVRDISIIAGRAWTYHRAFTDHFLEHQFPGPGQEVQAS